MRVILSALAIGLAAGSGIAVPLQPSLAQAPPVMMRAIDRPALRPPAGDWTLKGVVLLSRHGMRGPVVAVDCDQDRTDPNDCLDAVGDKPWPTLNVAAGHLVLPGYDRVRTLGAFYRQRYAEAGVVPAHGCPVPAAVSFASDNYERTVITAGAVMDGMFPGCFLDSLVIAADIYRGPSCGYDKKLARQAAQQLVGGSWAAVAAGPLAKPLAAMDRIIGPLKPEVCRAKGLGVPCSINSLAPTAEEPGVIGFVAQPAEQFIVQHGSGLPAADVGWGRIAEATGRPLAEGISYVNEIHALSGWASGAAGYQAAKRGSQVLSVIVQNLTEIAAGKGATFRFLASHDSYILNVAGLLGLSWQLESYPRNQVPLGGAIAFELWQGGDGAQVVRPVYYAPTIEQLHANPPLTLASPPAAEVLPVGTCKTENGTPCAWSAFATAADSVIDRACLSPAAVKP